MARIGKFDPQGSLFWSPFGQKLKNGRVMASSSQIYIHLDPFSGGTMIVGSSHTVNKNCFLHRVYKIEFLSFGWKMKIGQVIVSSSVIVHHRPSSSVIVPRHTVDPFFLGRWRTMIVGSSRTLNKNCSLHRVYIMNFFAVGRKVKNGQDFGLIVPHNSYTYGGPFFFGTMTDDDCWIKSDSKQKLFLT